MKIKINESTTSSSDGVFKGKLNITPRIWKDKQLIPYTEKVSGYVNNGTAFDSYDGEIKKSKQEIAKDEKQMLRKLKI